MIARLRACLDMRAQPYERLVCQGAWCIRIVFVLTPALAFWSATASVPAWWGVRAGLSGAIVGWAARLLATWACGWLGGFLWADVLLEESYRELMVGAAVCSNLFPTCTQEGYAGYKAPTGRLTQDDVRNQALFNDGKFRVWLPWERSGQPIYGDPPADTWAVRLHHRVVRPRLVRRGVPGYEVIA